MNPRTPAADIGRLWTLADAERLVRDALDRSGALEVTILPARTIERPFGWVFITEHSGANPTEARLIIVNKLSEEILGAPMTVFGKSSLDVYEGVLKAGARQDWCLTLGGRWRLGGRWMERRTWRDLEKVGFTVFTSGPGSSGPGGEDRREDGSSPT